MQFPFPLGGTGGFYSEPRVNKSRRAIDNALGRGGLTSEWTSVNRRLFQGLARVHASVSLSTERIGWEMFPFHALPEDLLPVWEERLKVTRQQPDTTEERQWDVNRVGGDNARRMPALIGEGAGRGTDMTYKLDDFVGTGNTAYKFNTRASLLLLGADQRGIFNVGFTVPISQINTVAKHRRLTDVMRRYIPAHVGAALGREGNALNGFKTDDPDSLTDRDMLFL